ncbi:MAG: hypothetical protein K2N84_06935, partial [Clostridia bacterium]|nr:hypothetical protein [Clostridia bacterium]
DVDKRQALHIPSGYKITLDLNGKKLNRNLTAATVGGCVILNNGSLTITDSSGNNSGQITGGYNTLSGGGITCQSGSLTLESGTIYKNFSETHGGGIVANSSTFIMNGGVISSNEQKTISGSLGGGGVFVGGNSNSSSFTLNGGKIIKNKANYGGGVSMGGATFTMNGGIIGGVGEGNETTNLGQGGGLYGYPVNDGNKYDINLEGGTISYNEAHGSGGGISCNAGHNLYLKGVDILHNVAHCFGGGVIFQTPFNGTFEMSDGLIAENEADGSNFTGMGDISARGGAMYINTSKGTFIFSGGTVTKNKLTGTTNGNSKGASGIEIGMEANPLDAAAADQLKEIQINGPFVCDGNQDGNFSIYPGLVKFKIGGLLNKGGKTAHIGVSATAWLNTPQLGTIGTGVGGSQLTSGYLTNWGNSSNPIYNMAARQVIFFPDDIDSIVIAGHSTNEVHVWQSANYFTPGTATANRIIGTWEYKLNGGAWQNVPVNGTDSATPVEVPYGTTVSGVRVKWTQVKAANTPLNRICSTVASECNPSSITPFGASGSIINRYQGPNCASDNEAFPSGGVSAVGKYTFLLNSGNTSDGIFRNPVLNIEIVPTPVTITIADKVLEYGKNATELSTWLNDSANGVISGLPNGVTAAQLGVTLEKTYGTDANRTYTVRGKWNPATNPNYKVTFANVSKLTIKPRTVNILLNDEEVVYGGDVKEAEIKKINDLTDTKILHKNFNETQAKDKDNNPRTDGGTPAKPVYIGGWRYFDSTGTNAVASKSDTEHQLVARDLDVSSDGKTATKLPFEYEITYTSAAWESADTDKYFKVGDYTLKLKGTNDNYKFTFYNASEQEGDAKLKVIKAEFADSLKTSTSTPKYDEVANDGTAKTIALPTDTLTLQGYQGATEFTAVTQKHLVYTADTIPNNLKDTNSKNWADETKVTEWASATATSTSKTDAGTYTVFTLVKQPNHNAKVYKW